MSRVCALLLLSGCLFLCAQTDDFNDSDDAGWVHWDPRAAQGAPAIIQVREGAYHLSVAARDSPFEFVPMAASYPPTVYSNFFASVDLVDWDEQSSQVFGILARYDGRQTGLYCVYWTAGSGIFSFRMGTIATGSFASQSINLVPGRGYRIVFTGIGPNLVGELYSLTNLSAPLLRLSGVNGLYEQGYVALGAQPWAAFARADVTYDNYRAMSSPPAPVIVRQPMSQIVEEGRAVTFGVEADGFQMSYQWYANGVPIPDATVPSYTTEAVSLADDGTQYSVLVSSAAGDIVSTEAVLNVMRDVKPPRVLSAVAAVNLTNIVIAFSEPVRAFEAEDLFNYQISLADGSGDLGHYEARLIEPDTVLLTTDPRIEGCDYVIAVTSIRDVSPNGHLVAPTPTRRGLAVERLLIAGDGQPWTYFQSDTEPGAGWQWPGFNDTVAPWASGPAVFDAKWPPGRVTVGPNSEPVRTVLNLTNPPGALEITRAYYFRTHFMMPELRPGTVLRLEPLVDDGAVFYLNGAECYRLNMAAAPTPIGYSAFALSPRSNAQLVYDRPYEIAATNLAAGENVLAAEVHQAGPDSLDMSFGVRMTAIIPPQPARLRIVPSLSAFELSWTGAGYRLEEARNVAGPWSVSANQENPQLAPPSPDTRFFRLQRD